MGWGRWLLLGDIGQQLDLNDVRHEVERLRSERDLSDWGLGKVRELADDLLELELRHGLLVRLLISKGVFTAEEYANLIAAARPDPTDAPAPEQGVPPGDR